jgi:hypothetical protein
MTRSGFLPDVVIGGAPRSGTTFLCELLNNHPGIYVARPFIPEPKVCMTPDPAGDDGFRRRYAELFKDAPASLLRVEKTSYYLENDSARERLVRLLPDARFVFILREPIARAYSNWLWSTANRLETLPFAEAVAREGKRPSPLPPTREYARPFDYMSRGRYGTFAEAWVTSVGRDRTAFYIFEIALLRPESFVEHLQRFIGVDPLSWDQLRTDRVNANPLEAPALDPALMATLRRQIRPEIEQLARLTGLDISIWNQ